MTTRASKEKSAGANAMPPTNLDVIVPRIGVSVHLEWEVIPQMKCR